MLIPKREIIRSDEHLKFIRMLPCVMTGMQGGCDPAHIRKGFNCMGVKPPDSRVVPLTYAEHRKQHNKGEPAYWGDLIDRAIWLSGLLWDNTGDFEKCEELIKKWKTK